MNSIEQDDAIEDLTERMVRLEKIVGNLTMAPKEAVTRKKWLPPLKWKEEK